MTRLPKHVSDRKHVRQPYTQYVSLQVQAPIRRLGEGVPCRRTLHKQLIGGWLEKHHHVVGV